MNKRGKIKCVVGLRNSSAKDITDLARGYRVQGFRPVHVTETLDGTKLPFNGVLKVYYKY